MIDYQIDYLSDVPDLAEQLIPGLLEHWQPKIPDQSFASRQKRFQEHQQRDSLPMAWIAHQDECALGTAALRAHELDGYDHCKPWLGGLFVRSQFRRLGIATALCNSVEHQAKEMGYQTLYLFTLDRHLWFGKQGWQSYESLMWNSYPGDIMYKNLYL
jgi:GNAT superfamily N-acetyltransferase